MAVVLDSVKRTTLPASSSGIEAVAALLAAQHDPDCQVPWWYRLEVVSTVHSTLPTVKDEGFEVYVDGLRIESIKRWRQSQLREMVVKEMARRDEEAHQSTTSAPLTLLAPVDGKTRRAARRGTDKPRNNYVGRR